MQALMAIRQIKGKRIVFDRTETIDATVSSLICSLCVAAPSSVR
jgi:hypothetical protein